MTIANTSSRKLKVTVRARPWRQARSGTVAADRRRTLSRYVTVSAGSFTLAAGVSRGGVGPAPARAVPSLALREPGRRRQARAQARRDQRRLPDRRQPALQPACGRAALSRLKAGAAHVARKQLSLSVRNAGNTIDAVGGTVSVSGPGGGRSGTIAGVKILPGKGVRLPLLSLAGLRRPLHRVGDAHPGGPQPRERHAEVPHTTG